MLYMPSSKFSCYSKCSEDGGCSGYWYSSEGSMSTHDRNAKTRSSTYTYMQTKPNAKKQYTNTIKQYTKLSYNYSTRYNDRVDIKNA
jgi:hypothetical protein